MKVLMLTWEYPPRIVGGLARHVFWLTRSLVRAGAEVDVFTISDRDEFVEMNGVRVHKVGAYRIPSPDFISWVQQFNMLMARSALLSGNRYDIIHAHDWLVAHAAIALKHVMRRPLVVTIHSTEHGRRHGLHDDFQRHIHEWEWLLTYEGWRVIVCSGYMKWEVSNVLGVPHDKIEVIPNGVNPIRVMSEHEVMRARARYALPWERIVLFVGRMVHEKGPHVLLEAARIVLSRRWDLKFIFVGEGPMREHLMRRAHEMGIGAKVYFTGFVHDNELEVLYNIADIAVFPSLYEPFGIVALEAMSAKKPIIVSNVGGLAEIVDDYINGIKVNPGDPWALAQAIERLVDDRELARRLGENGYRKVHEVFSWNIVAKRTIEVYERVLEEYERVPWKPTF